MREYFLNYLYLEEQKSETAIFERDRPRQITLSDSSFQMHARFIFDMIFSLLSAPFGAL